MLRNSLGISSRISWCTFTLIASDQPRASLTAIWMRLIWFDYFFFQVCLRFLGMVGECGLRGKTALGALGDSLSGDSLGCLWNLMRVHPWDAFRWRVAWCRLSLQLTDSLRFLSSVAMRSRGLITSAVVWGNWELWKTWLSDLLGLFSIIEDALGIDFWNGAVRAHSTDQCGTECNQGLWCIPNTF